MDIFCALHFGQTRLKSDYTASIKGKLQLTSAFMSESIPVANFRDTLRTYLSFESLQDNVGDNIKHTIKADRVTDP